MDNVVRGASGARGEKGVDVPIWTRSHPSNLIFLAMIATMVLGHAPAALGAGGISPPSASGFAAVLVTSTNQYAEENGASSKVERADCVEPVPGRYMCSYALRDPSGTFTCHLMQARWTPAGSSLFTVTLAGRTRSCANLSDALHSLSGGQAPRGGRA
jgi:hypothetical protein